jgi:signal transduction histidine kinase
MMDMQGATISKSKRIITKVLSGGVDKGAGRKMMKATLADKMKYRRKDSSEFYVAITVSPIVVDNKVDGVIQVVRDITQEVAIDQAKNEFISLASHQLRTPLTATKWYSELLLDDEAGHLTPRQRKYAQETLNGTNRTIKLVNVLLDVSHVESGILGVYAEPTNIAQLLTKLMKGFTEETEAHQLLVSEDYEANLPKLQVDPNLLQIILTNLLTNAIKYTPEKGVITLTLRNDRGGIVIAISDTGYGIPSAQQDKIFTKMFRADNARLRVADGTGLGLYLAKSIADYTGCDMWFESTENKGSIFYLRIPKKGMERKHGTTEVI